MTSPQKAASTKLTESNKDDRSTLAAEDSIQNSLVLIPTTEARKLKRNFGSWSILAAAFSICNSWVGISVTFGFAISLGGSMTLLYGIILVSFSFAATGITLAELASVYPTAGGQYHFTSILATKRYNKSFSYACGLLAVFSWLAITASVTISVVQMIFALVGQYHDFVPHAWLYFLLYQVINIVVLVYNLFVLRKTIFIYDIGLVLTLSLFVIITITCGVRSQTTQSSRNVWAVFVNNSGWSNGVSFLTGTSTPQFMFAGIDAALHLAEECLDAGRVVPKAVMSTVAIGFGTAFAFAISMSYSVTSLESLFTSRSGYPIYELWIQAIRSETAATVLFVATMFSGCIGLIAMQQTASRLTWSFARDNALVYSSRLSKVHPKMHVPIEALVVNALVVLLIGCLYLASTTAFNAFVATCTILQQISFAMPAALLLYRRRSETVLPRSRSFRVPSTIGYAANIICILWTLISTVFFILPTTLPVTPTNMNYAVVILSVLGLFGVLNWFFYAKKVYQGPHLEW